MTPSWQNSAYLSNYYGELTPDENEILVAQWFTLDEIKQLHTRDPWVLGGAELLAGK